MTRVLVMTDAFPPEIRSSSQLMKGLSLGLRDHGFDVTVLTTYPAYNLDPADRARFRNPATNVVRDEDGLRVVRVPTPPHHNVGRVAKGLSQLTFLPILAGCGALLGPFDAIVAYSPPLLVAAAAAVLKARFGARLVLNVQDLFPQTAIDLGVLNDRRLVAAYRWLETACYRAADVVTCHSEGNLRVLRAHPALRRRADDVQVVENGIDVGAWAAVPADPDLRREPGLGDRFIFVFGGVMGFAQDLDTIVRAAALLAGRDDLAFLLVGDGVARERARQLAAGLPNVRFHPLVPPERFMGWVKAADAGLVTLRAELKTPVVPSKILGFMAAGRPFLAIVPPESDAWGITTRAHCGLTVAPGDPQALARAAVKLASERGLAQGMGTRGQVFCQRHFTLGAQVDKYVAILHSLTRPGEG